MLCSRLDAAPSLEPIEEVRHNRWNVDRHTTGRGMLGGRAVAIDVRSDGSGAMWVALYTNEASSADRTSVGEVISSWRMLPSHACECSYDCDPRVVR
jgi:hypothetical protein